MRTTIDLDDDLVARARAFVPKARTRTGLIHKALRARIHARASRVLAAAGGGAKGRAHAAPRPKPGSGVPGPLIEDGSLRGPSDGGISRSPAPAPL